MRTKKRSDMVVVESNDLVRRVRDDMKLAQRRLLLYLISLNRPDDRTFVGIQMSVSDFYRVCGLEYDGGSQYETVKQVIRELAREVYWIKSADGYLRLFSWLDNANTNISPSGVITIRLSNSLAPYLLELREGFTAFHLQYALCLTSKHSIRLYELLQSWRSTGSWTVDVAELRDTMGVNLRDSSGAVTEVGYPKYYEFNRTVLTPSIAEINRKTDLFVETSNITTGRRIDAITFTIREKSPDELYALQSNFSHLPDTIHVSTVENGGEQP